MFGLIFTVFVAYVIYYALTLPDDLRSNAKLPPAEPKDDWEDE